jgi:beta-N-acetylhexosaminidase
MSRPLALPLGPVMLDVAGTVLTGDDRQRLAHPLVGGVILFARNYSDPGQLAALTAQIHALRTPALPIGVDHEGGRVQRFRDGFLALPAMRRLGRLWDTDPSAALRASELTGYALAAELVACGVDFSFTPVLDLEFGHSAVIGDRAFHADPLAVSSLAGALIAGLRRAGMACVGKHFPGHGWAGADSHTEVPVDPRSFAEIERADLLPYARLTQVLTAVMPAHVIYPRVDAAPAGFSRRWLMHVLRARLGYQGAILSDDLSMEGASVAGDVNARAAAALGAGCDMVLVCNRPDLADQLLDSRLPAPGAASSRRIAALGARAGAAARASHLALRASSAWQQAAAAVNALPAA